MVSRGQELTHGELEVRLQAEGRELLRQLTQDHLDLRALRETRLEEVVGADGVRRTHAETGRSRSLGTVFGSVTVRRSTYRQPGYASLYPADSVLNLPAEKYSHGLRLLAARDSARGSFAEAGETIARISGQRLGNRQVEELTGRAAVDFDQFYAQRLRHLSIAGDVLVLSYDGKGVVMRPGALRPATAAAAARATPKLATRLSRGEKRHRKRMAEVGSVYDCTPVPRSPEDILAPPGHHHPSAAGPTAHGKWLTASITAEASEVIGAVFDEAERRDPDHDRRWVVLVDGNAHQIQRTHAQARTHHAEVTIVIDFIHVLEYVWKAAWSLFDEADPAAEAVLTLRALHSNGDFDDYWNYHLTQEKHRIHQTCYQNEVIPHV